MADVPNYGLLNNMASGIKEGMLAYQTSQNMQRQNQLMNLAYGVQNGENGLEYTPQKQAEIDANRQFQTVQRQHQLGLLQPGSTESQHEEKMLGMLGHQVDPGQFSGEELQELEGNFMKKDQAKAQLAALGMRGQNQANRFEETQNVNAGKVGQAYEGDHLLQALKGRKNALVQANSIVSNDTVTANDLNTAWGDYVKSTAPGGDSTEGQAHRDIPTTAVQKFEGLLQNFDPSADMRSTDVGKGLVALLKQHVGRSEDEIDKMLSDQAEHIHSNFLDSTNQKVQETNERKYNEYKGLLNKAQPQEKQPGMPSKQENAAAIAWAKSNINDPKNGANAKIILEHNGVQ